MTAALDRTDNRGLHSFGDWDAFTGGDGNVDRMSAALDLLKKAAHDGTDRCDTAFFDLANSDIALLDGSRGREGINKETAHSKKRESRESHVGLRCVIIKSD